MINDDANIALSDISLALSPCPIGHDIPIVLDGSLAIISLPI
jgi:hypothetical protein